jgi:hypothetical protein
VAPGGDVVLEAVPGADDVHRRLVEHRAEAALLGVESFAHPGHDPTLARRPALVGADVLVGVEPPAEAEDADRDAPGSPAERDDQAPALGDLVARPDVPDPRRRLDGTHRSRHPPTVRRATTLVKFRYRG